MKWNFMRRIFVKKFFKTGFLRMKKKNFNSPPESAEKLLRILIRYGNRQSLLGDLEEHYGGIVKRRGLPAALL